MSSQPMYLGDGVYVQQWMEEDGLVLSVGSHILSEAGETIYLEPSVLQHLEIYMAEYKARCTKTT